MNGGKNGTPKARRKKEAGLFLEGSGSSRARKGKKSNTSFWPSSSSASVGGALPWSEENGRDGWRRRHGALAPVSAGRGLRNGEVEEEGAACKKVTVLVIIGKGGG